MPHGTPVVNALAKQRAMLENIMRACVGLPPDNNMVRASPRPLISVTWPQSFVLIHKLDQDPAPLASIIAPWARCASHAHPV